MVVLVVLFSRGQGWGAALPPFPLVARRELDLRTAFFQPQPGIWNILGNTVGLCGSEGPAVRQIFVSP